MTLLVALCISSALESKYSFPGGTGKEVAEWVYRLTNEPVMFNVYSAVPFFEIDLKEVRRPEESQSAYIGRLIATDLKKKGVSFEYAYLPDKEGLGMRIMRPNRTFPRVTNDGQFWETFATGFPTADRRQVTVNNGLLNFNSGSAGSIVVNEVAPFFKREDHWLVREGTISIAGKDISEPQFRDLRLMCTPVKLDDEGNMVIDRKRATQWMLDASVSKHGQQLSTWAIEVKQSIFADLISSLSEQEFLSIFEKISSDGPRFTKDFPPMSTVHQAAVGFHNKARAEGPYLGDNAWYLDVVKEITHYGDADTSHPVTVTLGTDGRLAFTVMTSTGNAQMW